MKSAIKKIYLFLIRFDFFTDIMIRLIVAKYNRLNRNASKNLAIKTPWVCEFPYSIDRCLDYIDEVYADYIRNSGLTKETFVGKQILEVGPGENLGVALKFIANGAQKVVCVDRFSSLIDENRLYEIYYALYSRMGKDEKDALSDVISFSEGSYKINTNYIVYNKLSIDQLTSLFAPSSFDLIISRAVLEHVFYIRDALDVMHELLRKGGYMLHEIDFRDHGMFTEWLLPEHTFLTVPPKKWTQITTHLGAPNRMLYSQYVSYFSKKEYDIRTVIVYLVGNNKKVCCKTIPADFRKTLTKQKSINRYISTINSISEDDLLVNAAFFCLHKR